ncbi:DNA-directed RNA polymerase subunit K [Candidatus Woesearchaeota archaeon]|nr:DNA-directed RNA polymerase subunit K [Candidatus Woesearchaeota archaeon]
MDKKIIYTKYEKARIIGARALQLAMGAPLLIKMSKKDLEEIRYSPIEISKREFDDGILPITIKRPLPQRVS